MTISRGIYRTDSFIVKFVKRYQQNSLYAFFHGDQLSRSAFSSAIKKSRFSSRRPETKSMLCERTIEVR